MHPLDTMGYVPLTLSTMDAIEKLIADIEAYCAKHGMAETTFGRLSVNDGKLVERLRGGKSITLKTLDTINSFLAAPRPTPAPQEAA